MNQIPFDDEKWKGWSESKTHSDPNSTVLPTVRQLMIRDLIENHLPGKNREEIESILGKSPIYISPYADTGEDVTSGGLETDNNGESRSAIPNTSHGYGLYGWDLSYDIGRYERDFFDTHHEHFFIRLGKDGKFESWYIVGNKAWPQIVGEKAAASYREGRSESYGNP